MAIHNKTKEELTKELHELQQAYHALKATIETDLLSELKQTHSILQDINKRKQEEEALRLSEKQSVFLAQTAFDLVELTSIQEIYKYTVQKLFELFEGNSIVALVENNNRENRWKMQQIVGVGKKATALSRLFGFDINNMEGEISTKYYQQITGGRVKELNFDLPGLFNNKLSAAVGSAVKKLFSIEKMYCIAFKHDENIFGNITFVTNKKTEPINTKLIEAFVQQVSNFVRKQKAEEALRKSEEMMLNSQSVAHICSYSTNLNENDVEKSLWVCSPEFYSIFGIDKTYPHTIAGWAGLIHPDFRKNVVAYHKSVIKEKKSFNLEYKIIRKNDGMERWVHGTGKLDFNENGNPVRMHGAIQDITQRKQAEMLQQVQYNVATAVIESKNLSELFDSIRNELNNVIDSKNIFIAIYNQETGRLSSILDKDEKDEISEWPAEKSITGIVVRQGRSVLLRRNDILRLQNEGIIEIVGTLSAAWLGVPLKIEDKVLGAIVVQNYENPDIYDQTSIEILELVAHELSIFIDNRRASETANKLSKVVEQSSVSVLITNKKGYIEYVNPFFTTLTGYSFEEVIGKNPGILKSGHHPNSFYETLWNTINSGNNWEGEILNKKKNGDLHWEKTVISPILNSDGVVTNFVAIKDDITERKKMLEKLVETKEKAEESDKLKTAFLNNISHEIRTPLNGILGFGEFLTEAGRSAEDRKEMLAYIQSSSNRLINTITDYIDMAMIVSGTMEVNKKEFLLQPLYIGILEKTKQLCAGKQLSFEAAINSEHDDLKLDSDPELISKILNNLFDNALKFTEKGTISCDYKLNNGFVEFFVQDTGKGIDSNKLEMIFNMFTQEEISLTRSYEGSGLGLSIARGLVTLLGGTISVTSEKDKGSTFTFTVPNKKSEVAEKAQPEEKKSVTAHMRPLILIAEDDESNYQYMEIVLKMAGFDHLLARNGEEAVAICQQRPEITLVLMDIKMPGMNGLEATKIIREFRNDVPIIATTAYAQTNSEQRFLDAGFNGYLAKPIRKEKLLAVLNNYAILSE